MKKRLLSLLLVCCAAVLLFAALPVTAQAETEGDWEYSVSSGVATVTKYNGTDAVVTIPDTFGLYQVTSIGNSAFEGNVTLTQINFPKGLTSIGAYAFKGCLGLKELTLPAKLTTLGAYAFQNCTWLEKITFTCGNLQDIYLKAEGYEARCDQPFYGAGTAGDGIEVVFAEGCTRVPANLFYAYSGKEHAANVTSVTLADTVTYVGANAFRSCIYLKDVKLGNGIQSTGSAAFHACSALTNIDFGTSIATIGDNTFGLCTALTSVKLPESLTTIEHHAFSECKALASVPFPKSLTTIGESAFAACVSITEVTLPEKLTTLGAYVFMNCTRLDKITVNSVSINDIFLKAEGYQARCDQPFYGAGTAGDGIEVVFAEGCTRVPANLFYAYSGTEFAANVTSITLADTVTHVGANAFRNCESLKSVKLGNGVQSTGSAAFLNCVILANIDFGTSIATIGDNTFAHCDALTEIKLPESLTAIEHHAFWNCNALKDIPLPKSLTKLGEGVFKECVSITEVTLPEKLATLGPYVFQDCAQLEKITFECVSLQDIYLKPEGYQARCDQPFYGAGAAGNGIEVVFAKGCTRIPANLFYGYSGVDTAANITSVTVADTVTEVGNNAFTNCGELKTIKFLGSNPTIGGNSFSGVVATGYHPGWPQEALLDYGGTITWIGEAACAHAETTVQNAKAATCTAEGYTGDTVCASCGETLEAGEPIPMTDHTEEILPAVAPTCKDTGLTEGKKCSVCGETLVKQETIPVTDHTWDAGKITTEATPDAPGVKTFTCTVCGETKTEPVVFNCTHTTNPETKVVNQKDATCAEEGYTGDTVCVNCGEVLSKGEVIPKTDHTWDEGKVTTEATPEKPGVKTFTCTVCQATKTEEIRYVNPDIPPVPELPEEPVEDTSIFRIAGDNRFETAFMVANQMKENLGVEKFNAIIVASGTNFADALSGSYLAAVKQAPILLSYNEEFNDRAKNYIRENLADGGIVYILGGEKAVPESMRNGLEGIEIKRLAGGDRFGTNLAILEEAGVGDKPILVCTGIEFADSLSGSATELPILLVWRSLTEEQQAFLSGLSGNKLYIIGGESAVSTKLQLEVGEYGATKRLGGKNRFETSVMIAKEFFTAPESVVLA